MLWEVGNLYNTPIIIGCPNSDIEYNKKNKYGITNRGLFVPPITSGVNASFMSGISVWLHGKDKFYNNNLGKYKIAGYRFDVHPNKSELFFNTLEIKDLNIVARISLNVTNNDLKLLDLYPHENKGVYVNSVNRINIKNPSPEVSNWLDAWSVVYINSEKANTYAHYYDFYEGRKGKAAYCGRPFKFAHNGDYVVEQCEGVVVDYPHREEIGWSTDDMWMSVYGGNTADIPQVKDIPPSPWPIK